VRPQRNWCEDFEVVMGSKLAECSDDGLGKVAGALQALTGTQRAADIAAQAQMLLQERVGAAAPAEEQPAEEQPAEEQPAEEQPAEEMVAEPLVV
jgi:hypothetical protein